MDEHEFDKFADSYYEQHRDSISISGEEPEFFSEYKISYLRRVADSRGLKIDKIFDFGSGIGNSIIHFRNHFPESILTCSDASLKSLKLSQKRFGGTEKYLQIPNNTIPHESNYYDLIFSACVFHHISHSEHTMWLNELRRITKPGGMIIIFEHNPLNPLTVLVVNQCPFDVNAKLIRASLLLNELKESNWHNGHIRYHIFFPKQLAKLRQYENKLTLLPLGAQYSILAQKI